MPCYMLIVKMCAKSLRCFFSNYINKIARSCQLFIRRVDRILWNGFPSLGPPCPGRRGLDYFPSDIQELQDFVLEKGFADKAANQALGDGDLDGEIVAVKVAGDHDDANLRGHRQ